MDNKPRCTYCNDVQEIELPCEMCQFTNGLPRPVVVRFAEDMEQRLQENDHKGEWSRNSKQELASLLTKASSDLMIALAQNADMQWVTTRAADVANIAMMIANNEQMGVWPDNGVVIQDMDTGLYLKLDPETTGVEDFPFIYVDRVDKSERYERAIDATWVAYTYGEANRRYRVIDHENGGVQYVYAGAGLWAVEGSAEATALPADRFAFDRNFYESRKPIGD